MLLTEELMQKEVLLESDLLRILGPRPDAAQAVVEAATPVVFSPPKTS